MTMTIAKIIFSVAAAAAIFVSAPAAAQDAESARVYYGDLDLSSAKGVARFNSRVAYAAKQVCGTPSALDMTLSRHARACRDAVMNSVSVESLARRASGARYAAVSVPARNGN